MQVTILGCGTSSGVPRLGGPDGAGDWGLCDPTNPRNRRRRVSILIDHQGTRLLVDTGPDLREQLLAARIAHLDGVFLTHDHADHCHGIDDLRPLFHAMRRPVDVWASPATWSVLRQRFAYVFEGAPGYPPTAHAHTLADPLQIGAITITAFPQLHGDIESTGLRFEADGKAIAYSTDVKAFDTRADAALADLDLWVVDALRRPPHPTHSHLEQTLDWINRYRPARALLTHMDQSMDYAALTAELPPHVAPAYDGLVVGL
ncbi:MBL fold metallo-hydrolase [Polymorphobacter sp.]|uniref:MBL fold metallo-hydrolase n=1 Tax=Polymorphobacter sp. TaxID=1909290 RepID=UPI003F729BF1